MNLKDLASATFAPKKRTLDITEEMVGAIRVVHFNGDLDIKTLPKAKACLEAILEPSGTAKAGKAPVKSAKAAKVVKGVKVKAPAATSKLAAPTGPLKIIIDLEDVEYIDSSGLGFFIGTLKKVKELKGDLKLAHLNAYMMGIFKLINMHYIIEIHENLEKAIKSFGSSRRAAASGRAYKE